MCIRDSLWTISRSVTRDIIGVTDIGLKSEKSLGGVFFGTGVTIAAHVVRDAADIEI